MLSLPVTGLRMPVIRRTGFTLLVTPRVKSHNPSVVGSNPTGPIEVRSSPPGTPCPKQVQRLRPGRGRTRGNGIPLRQAPFIQDGGTVDLFQPELLFYEPEKNGKPRFVGVEYIVPVADHPAGEAPPTLLGKEFERVTQCSRSGAFTFTRAVRTQPRYSRPGIRR
jgi:hypothetical protein